jgi:hypothetical protein
MSVALSGACQGVRFDTAGPGEAGMVGSGGSTATSIVGTWRRTLVVQTTDDVLSSETTWVFSSDESCERTVVTTSVLAGFPDTVRSPCSYTLAGPAITIRFDGTTGSVTFTAVVGRDTLTLDGVEFARAE